MELFCCFGSHSLFGAGEHEADQAGERGKTVGPSQGEFLLIEGAVILGEGRLDAVVLGIIGLDHRLPGQETST